MMHTTRSLLILVLALPALAATAQETAPGAAAFLDALKLAPEHEHLKPYVGDWTAEIKSYFDGSGEAAVSKGSATFTSLYNGRYLQQKFKGTFGGIPFEGMGLTGFDKIKKKFVGTWIDSFETGILTTEGTFDSQTQTMTEFGVSQTAEGELKMKNVTKAVDPDTMVFSMYMIQPDGSEKLTMKITYHRVK